MKLRGILLFGAFALFAALTFCWQSYMDKCYDEYISMVCSVETYVEHNKFIDANEELASFKNEFDRKLPYWNMFLPHSEIDPLRNTLSLLGAQIGNEDYNGAKESIALIRHILEHIKRLDRLVIDNIV